jgi:hypothetical protein
MFVLVSNRYAAVIASEAKQSIAIQEEWIASSLFASQ